MGKLVGRAPCKWLNQRNLVLNAMGMELLIKALTMKNAVQPAVDAALCLMTDKHPKMCGPQTASPSRRSPSALRSRRFQFQRLLAPVGGAK